MSEATLSRRGLMGLLGLAGAGAVIGSGAKAQDAETSMASNRDMPRLVDPNGRYPTVDLAKDTVSVSAIQSRLLAVDPDNARADMARNLAHVLDQFDAVFNYFGDKDLVTFHNFALQGWDKWTLDEIKRFAIRRDGPEVEAFANKAREYGCWASFGGYMVDPDWPGHVIDANLLVSPQGELFDVHWKTSNRRRQVPDADYYVTTVHDVLDQYVEMYGWDRVIPIARTPIGNILMTSVLREAELFRVAAMKGAEIFVRSGLGGFTHADGELTSRENGCYTMFMSNALSPDNPAYFPDNGYLGGTTVFGLRGEPLGQGREFETSVNGRLDIARLRSPYPRQPDIAMDLYAPHFAQYRSRFAPNAYAEETFQTFEAASNHIRTTERWGG